MLWHLREIQPDEVGKHDAGNRRWGVLGDLGVVEEISARETNELTEPRVDVVLPAADARASEILPLLQVGADRDVGHRVLDPIVVPRRADGDGARRLEADAGF